MTVEADRYRIGAVSRLTGIPAVTLRAWERRYNVVSARRDKGGSRLYSAQDVERLVLIKRLVDLGNAISTVAALPLAELEERVRADRERLRRSHGAAEARNRRVAVAGVVLAQGMRNAPEALAGLELVSAQTSVSELHTDLAGQEVDVLVLEYMTLHSETIEEVRQLRKAVRAYRAVVVYGFARRALIAGLEQDDIVAIAAPANLSELRLICLAPSPDSVTTVAVPGEADLPAADPQAPLPPRQFSAHELQRLSEASTVVECECPHQLSSLIQSLVAFEVYSAECENRNDDDAALHAYLHRTTAVARASIEQALQRVAKAEGLLPD